MAEGWARRLFPAGWKANSAGLVTHAVSRRATAVMAEAGLDLTNQYSKTYDSVDLDAFDLIVTLSEEAARFLPVGRAGQPRLHRPVADPMELQGAPETVRAAFRVARDAIAAIVRDVVTTASSGEVVSD